MAKNEEKYPDGKISKGDEGALAIAVTELDGRLILDFGKPVAWLGLDVETAIPLRDRITKFIEGRTS